MDTDEDYVDADYQDDSYGGLTGAETAGTPRVGQFLWVGDLENGPMIDVFDLGSVPL